MKTRFILVLAIVLSYSFAAAFAQEASVSAPYVPTPGTAVNTIYAELLGNAGTELVRADDFCAAALGRTPIALINNRLLGAFSK